MVSIQSLNFKKFAIILICAVLFFLFIIFAKNAYPVPAGDSQFFLVPAIQFTDKELLISPLFPDEKTIDLIIDPTGARRFLFEPPLFPLVLSVLMYEPSPFGVFMALALINIAVLILSAFLFYKLAKRNGLNWSVVLATVLSILALASSLAETGRPETLVRLIVALALLVLFYVSRKYDWIFYGIFLGLIFATHPALGFISILILGIYFGATLKLNKIILKSSTVFLIAFFTALGTIALGPFGIKETIEGTWANAITISHVLGAEGNEFLMFRSLISRYLTSQAAPFYGLVILLIFVAGFYFLFKHWKKIASPIVLLFFISIF